MDDGCVSGRCVACGKTLTAGVGAQLGGVGRSQQPASLLRIDDQITLS
jgi:hypothetical protein